MDIRIVYFFCCIFLWSCTQKVSKIKDETFTDQATTLFTKIEPSVSNINFQNNVHSKKGFNFMSYPYMYAGAGLAVGDIDNDGLEDIYFVGNNCPSKLYKNLGNFKFKDITVFSKTEDVDGFSTGVTMLDVNNDGWLDIYVCKAASLQNNQLRKNILFVNQQDGTFKEEAKKWGLNDNGLSTQAYPIDYDKDGDLDLYLVNYRYDFTNNGKVSAEIQNNIEEVTSDQLYRNDGTQFTKVTGEAGLYNKAWGLSAAIGDFNNDGWDDIYVSNDFVEPDALYINQKNGTFKNQINKRLNHISFNSMGSDFADLNNDTYPDLITLDMLAEDYARSKENMASMSTSGFKKMIAIGYHHAYMANMLHYNEGNGKFKETAQLSGVVKTDWSWAPLIADFDNDGLKDIYITNGVFKDYHNQDFRNLVKHNFEHKIKMSLDEVMSKIPSEKLNNYIFKNNGDLTFEKTVKKWGLEDPSFSNGAIYSDLDNDGDLDLVTNNFNSVAGLYRNNANTNYFQIRLKGSIENALAIGTKVYLKNQNKTQFQELHLTRGYFSSVTNILHFGLGKQDHIE
ncbi:MAG: CRTAC1 family protein, partial [Flavobacteriales bacterium]